MKYALISVEKVSFCLNCNAHDCSQCLKYNTHDKIIKIISTAETYNQILSNYHKLDKSNTHIKYQIRQVALINPKKKYCDPDYLYAILETIYLLNDKNSIQSNEIISYDYSFPQIKLTYENIMAGKIKTTSHFDFMPYIHWSTWNLVRLSKKFRILNLNQS